MRYSMSGMPESPNFQPKAAPEPLRPIDVPGQELDVNDLASHLASFVDGPERSGASLTREAAVGQTSALRG